MIDMLILARSYKEIVKGKARKSEGSLEWRIAAADE